MEKREERGIWKGEGGEGEEQTVEGGKGRGEGKRKRKKRREGRREAVGGLRSHFSGFHLYRVEELPPSFLAGLSFPSEPQSPPRNGHYTDLGDASLLK